MTITGPYHVNVNCSDLTRSLQFYTDVLGFSPVVHTAPDVQSGAAFGFAQAQWDAWILGGGDGSNDGVVLDLLEWKEPAPGRSPIGPDGESGFTHLLVSVPDPTATAAQCEAVAEEPWMTSSDHWVRDPDGTVITLVPGPHTGLVGIGIRSFDPRATLELLASHLVSPSGFRFEVEPGSNGGSTRAANDLGIFRMAWLTDDLETDHARLLGAGLAELSGPVPLAMGIDDGAGNDVSLEASFLTDANGCCFELIAPPS